MKFSEIKKFTRNPDYKVNQSWRTLVDWIEEQDRDENLQLNPDFQRGHVWNESQQVAYVEYVLRGGSSGLDIYFNHPGWSIGRKGEFVCVDGLQRLTAVIRFMKNEIRVFGQTLEDFGEPKIPYHTHFNFHINDLQTRKEILTWYVEMNSGGTAHTQEEIDRVKQLINQSNKGIKQ